MDIELVTDPDACMYIVSPLRGLGGGILWRPPAYSLLLLNYARFMMRIITRSDVRAWPDWP